jgi:hypothetical protein
MLPAGEAESNGGAVLLQPAIVPGANVRAALLRPPTAVLLAGAVMEILGKRGHQP